MANIYRPLKIYNGSAWDYIYLDVMENCIKGGWNQKDVDYGSYRVLPGGWVIFEVWAYLHFNANVEATARVTPPLAFSKPPVAVACSKYWQSTGAWGYMANVSAKIDTNNDIIIGGYQINGSSSSDALAVQIIGIGRV